LEGVLRDSAVVGPMINKLRDERHEVSSQGGQDLRGSKSTASGPMGQYGWRFQALMAVAPGIEEAEAAAPAAGKAPAVPVKTPATPEKTAPAATGQTAGR
ncbi:MAG TPA: hypothetical protein VGE52_20840, partial [Pirellulales bacterium]